MNYGKIGVGLWLMAVVGCSGQTGYVLTSYKSSPTGNATVTLRHGHRTITAECSSACSEFGALVGQELSCFVEPPPSDPNRPYETRRPIFNSFGGTFVCHAGKGRVFMIRHHSCEKQTTPVGTEAAQRVENEYLEDSLYVPVQELDKSYCKPGEQLRDLGGDTVTEDGKVLPFINSGVEQLKIVEAKE